MDHSIEGQRFARSRRRAIGIAIAGVGVFVKPLMKLTIGDGADLLGLRLLFAQLGIHVLLERSFVTIGKLIAIVFENLREC